MADVNATPEAVARADELGVDLAEVEGSGKDGNILVADIEEAHQASLVEPEEHFEVRLNPRLPSFQLLQSVTCFDRQFVGGETLSESEYERYSKAESADGHQLIVKGREVS